MRWTSAAALFLLAIASMVLSGCGGEFFTSATKPTVPAGTTGATVTSGSGSTTVTDTSTGTGTSTSMPGTSATTGTGVGTTSGSGSVVTPATTFVPPATTFVPPATTFTPPTTTAIPATTTFVPPATTATPATTTFTPPSTNTTTGTTGVGVGSTGSPSGVGVPSGGVGARSVALQSSFVYGSPGRGLNVGRIGPAIGNITDSSTGGGSAFLTDIGGFIPFIEPDPKGRFLFTSESAGSSFGVPLGHSGISALTINRSTGAVAPAPNGSVTLNQPGQKIAVDPSGTHLYTVVGGSITVYLIDQTTGALTLGSASPASSTAGSLVILSPDGRFLFNVGNGSATTYTVNPGTGNPTATTFTVSTGATNEKDVAISPNGKFLYIIDASTATKVVAINADGSLTSLSPSPNMAGRGVSVAISPNSNFVYVVTASNAGAPGSLEVFQVDSSGALKSVSGSPFAQNTNPSFVALDASGRFLYLASQAGLIAFQANSTTGSVTQVSTASGSINNSQIIATAP